MEVLLALPALRKRKDEANLKSYQEQLQASLRVLKADEDRNEEAIREYVMEINMPILLQSKIAWREHIADLKEEVPRLQKLLEELRAVMAKNRCKSCRFRSLTSSTKFLSRTISIISYHPCTGSIDGSN